MVTIGQTVYYARLCSKAGIKDVLQLRVQSVSGNYFTAVNEDSKESYPFFVQQLHNDVFYEESRDYCKTSAEAKDKRRKDQARESASNF